MLSLAHSATGAFIATAVPNPLISTPLILASHYLEDYILHWDVGTGLSAGTRTRSDAIKYEFIDLLITIIFVYLIFQLDSSTLNLHAWYGAFVALVPDFLEAPRNFLGKEPAWLKPLNRFHNRFHHSTPNILLGLTPQILLLIAIVALSKF